MTPLAAPGRGAALLEPPRGRYVYAVRSRRTGRVSIGIDLTPNGACPLSCDYCQVSREARTAPVPVDLASMRRELTLSLRELAGEAQDLVFAGSGEPTWAAEFPEALAWARQAVQVHASALMVRVFTGGHTLGRPRVAQALEALVASEGGEVWVKLDAWSEASHRRFWRTRGQAGHELRLCTFGARTPVVLQCMLVQRPFGPTVSDTARGLAEAIARLLAGGCRVQRVVLSTLFRAPGDPRAALGAYALPAIEQVAEALRAEGVAVALPVAIDPAG